MTARLFVATLLLIAAMAALVIYKSAHEGELLVDATPTCSPKPNPCLKIDCNRPTKVYLT